MVLRNEIATNMNESQAVKVVSNLSYESMCNDSKLMKHFVGLTAPQFDALHSFLDSICPLDNIVYWSGKQSTGLSKKKTGPDSHFSTQERLFICLVRLRRGFTIKTLAVLLSTPERRVEETMIRKIFTTYIQLIYKVFRDMETVMFPTRELLRRFTPKVFKTMRNVRCIVDCTDPKWWCMYCI